MICSAFPNVCVITLNRNRRAKSILKNITVDSLHVYFFILRDVTGLCKFVFRHL